jgi:hypothetical protein
MALPPKTASTTATITVSQDRILLMVIPPLQFANKVQWRSFKRCRCAAREVQFTFKVCSYAKRHASSGRRERCKCTVLSQSIRNRLKIREGFTDSSLQIRPNLMRIRPSTKTMRGRETKRRSVGIVRAGPPRDGPPSRYQARRKSSAPNSFTSLPKNNTLLPPPRSSSVPLTPCVRFCNGLKSLAKPLKTAMS